MSFTFQFAYIIYIRLNMPWCLERPVRSASAQTEDFFVCLTSYSSDTGERNATGPHWWVVNQ